MILIDAAYINESGGLVLLEKVIKEFSKSRIKSHLLLDERIPELFINKLNIDYTLIKSNERNRKKFYTLKSNRYEKVFCFANVPPPIKINIETFILFHNKIIISSFSELNLFSIKSKLIYFLKKIYIRYRNKSHYKWIVQTKSMKKKLSFSLLISKNKILTIPLFSDFSADQKNLKLKQKKVFTYVADGGINKNHDRLLDAWDFLHQKYSVLPKLNLTVSYKFPKLITKINKLIKKGINISNHGLCNKSEIINLYNKSEYLIYPSLIESFGLPLIEANKFDCNIISSDLDYVHDIVKPSLVFDPNSVISISETVYLALNNDYIPKSKTLIKSKTNELLKLFYE